jgi:hypothetical protein
MAQEPVRGTTARHRDATVSRPDAHGIPKPWWFLDGVLDGVDADGDTPCDDPTRLAV